MRAAFICAFALAARAGAASDGGTAAADPLPTIAFGELFTASPRELKPSRKLLSLRGRRVRLAGYMVHMELPPKGAFYLAAYPLSCDEAGGGSADLPPEVVRVVVRSEAGRELPWVPRALEVTGVLEIGTRTEEDGRLSAIRLLLDRPEDLPRAADTNPTDPPETKR